MPGAMKQLPDVTEPVDEAVHADRDGTPANKSLEPVEQEEQSEQK